MNNIRKYAILISLWFCHGVNAQMDVDQLVIYADSMLNAGVSEQEIPGAVIGIASSDTILLLQGYGYADYNKQIPVNHEKTLFQVGSVGKLFTSVSFLQQVDEGAIGIKDRVNDYISDWKLKGPESNTITPFHLLTHSAGLNDQFIGYMAKSNEDVEKLGDHLANRMPGTFKSPGTEINYSNYSYALLGYLVEILSGTEFKDQVSKGIFEPLNMSTAGYFVPDNYLDIDQYANGYALRDTFKELKMYPRHAYPAGSLVASGRDMLTFAQALLRRDESLLTQESYDLMLGQQFSNHPELLGYSLGMEVQNFNGHVAYSKAGQVTGFLSVLIVFPDLDLTLVLSSNSQTDNFLSEFFEEMKNRFFTGDKVTIESLPFNQKEFVGNYANERCNHNNLEELFTLFNGNFQIYGSESGSIRAYHDGRWNDYQHQGNDVFYNIENPHEKMVFKRSGSKPTSLYRSVNVAGVQIPASYRKLGWLERPRFINDEYPYALLILFTYLLLPIIWLIKFLLRKRVTKNLTRGIRRYYDIAAFLFLGLFLWNIIGFFIPILRLREDITLGLPDQLMNFTVFNWAMSGCALILIFLSLKMWVKGEGKLWFRIFYSIFSLIAVSYVLMLHHWHLLTIEV